MPKVIIFAGANGSGKTTFANSTLESGWKFINADDIKLKNNLSDIAAGKKALQIIDHLIEKRTNFAFETTMSGILLNKRFNLLKKKKYYIVIYYLFVHTVDLLLERIKERIKRGGHFVRDEDVIRRYSRSLSNFWNKYRLYADEWNLINNNELEARIIVVGNKNKFQIIDRNELNILKELIKNGQHKKKNQPALISL